MTEPTAALATTNTIQTRPTFYQLYVCKSEKCFKLKNPRENSQHQRGVHVKSDKSIRVKCPGCGEEMQQGAYIDHDMHNHVMEGNHVKMRDGKRVFPVEHYGKTYEHIDGDPVVYQAVGHESVDQTAELAKEWEA